MKKIVSLLLTLCLVLSLSFACAETAYEPVTIQNGDRTITFTEMPQNVLCCHLYAAENMVMLGLADYICAKNIPGNAAEVPLEEIADQFEGIPEIERSHENAVASGAELVIGQVSAFGESKWGSYEMFESKGINCYTISGTLAADETVESVYEDIRALGLIFKVEDRAEQLIADIQGRIDAVQAAVADIPEEERATVFVMDSFNGNEIYTTSAGLQSNLIELAGAKNATRNMADSRWFTTSVETLVATNPDFIIFNDYGSQTILPYSAVLGAIYLIWADAAARGLFGGAELPLGIITAFVGAPFFMYLMARRKYGGKS